jgi:hypothetical protein
VDAWKSNPCTAIYHNYHFEVISDGCNGYVVPFIVGSMTGWNFERMQLDEAKTLEYGAPTYYYNKKTAEGTPYQLVCGLLDPNTGEIDSTAQPGWKDEAYLQMLVNDEWTRIPGEDGDNRLTHEDANIVWDIRVDTLRWARCAPAEPEEYVVFGVKLPAENTPESVEIIGTFDDWQGTAMEWLASTDYWFVELQAKASQFFKFRGAGSWDKELEIYSAEDDEWKTIADGQFKFGQLWEDDSYKGTPCKWIELDWSDPAAYRWTGAEGIEDIVLTEKAQKIVVDGVLYIVRDNKMYNVQGTQVR